MTSHYETEVKLMVADLKAAEEQLEALGATLTAPRVFERNVRYENNKGSFAENGIVLRLRQDSRARLTYKEGSTANAGIVSRFEAEVEVSDFETMELILYKLGYVPALVYEKYRITYQYHDAEIVLDELPYGNFVEVEGDPTAIEDTLKQLGMESTKRLQASYVRLFEFVKMNMGLKLNHLTFENFKGITVPPSAFEPPKF